MSEPQYLEFEVISHSQTVRVPYWPGSTASKLHAQWRATDSDDDFNELVEWMRDEIGKRIDFDVEDVR